MKKKILTLLSAVALLSSCSGMLDQYPHSAINPDNVSEKDIPAMRVGMYSSVQNMPQTYAYMIFDILGGDLTQTNYNPIDVINATLTPLNSIISGQWNGYFDALYQVNNMIEAANRFPNAKDARKSLGEAHYFRAWIYTNLATRWGAVPIIRQNTMDKVSRDPIEEVWAFINEDLEMAQSILADADSYYYASKNASKALQARVFLYQGKKKEAAALAEEIIESNVYELDDFSKIFSIDRPTNKETIFAFKNLNITESSISLGDYYYTYGHPNKGKGKYNLTRDIVKLFDDGDLRKANSIVTVEGIDCVNKYPSGQAGRDPFIVSRLAEMYLISAEGQGFPEGTQRLNELRKKRGLSPVVATDKDGFTDLILTERRLEFLGENQLYYDYVRLGKAVSVLGIQPYQQLFPIPGLELQLNEKLEANPGY